MARYWRRLHRSDRNITMTSNKKTIKRPAWQVIAAYRPLINLRLEGWGC